MVALYLGVSQGSYTWQVFPWKKESRVVVAHKKTRLHLRQINILKGGDVILRFAQYCYLLAVREMLLHRLTHG